MTGDMGKEMPEQIESLVSAPDLADALESEPFRHFLDQIPFAIVVSEMKGLEQIRYANPEFEKLSGQSAGQLEGRGWDVLHGETIASDGESRTLGSAIMASSDFVGTFTIQRAPDDAVVVDAYANIIEDEKGAPAYRLAALVNVSTREKAHHDEFVRQLVEKDTLLREIQHRVKNNLQMITALIRIETRNAQGTDSVALDRLAGRIESIGLLYKLLSEHEKEDEIDLGVYLSGVASSVMQAHAVQGIRLDLKVDTYPVSVNVAMPAGLVVNELLTNALKHAFAGREGGTVTLHSLAGKNSCSVTVSDDGIGLPENTQWPKRGKLGALIVRSLRENANADLTVESNPGKGTKVTILFTRADAAPEN